MNKQVSSFRNLLIRALTGAVFVAVMVGAMCIHPYCFLCVFALVVGFTLAEFYRHLKLDFPLLHILGGVFLFVASFFSQAYGLYQLYLIYLLYLLAAFIRELYLKKEDPIRNWAYAMLGQVYIAGSFSLLNFIAYMPDVQGSHTYSFLFMLAIFVFVWVNDTGAYLTGMLFGKHRLFERISPKKSWEGFFGGLVFVLLTSQVFAHFAPLISWYNWLFFSLAIILFGTWGDLVESLFKRTIHIKDSGKILPGHGGLMDRFDSVLFAIPVAYIYMELFVRL